VTTSMLGACLLTLLATAGPWLLLCASYYRRGLKRGAEQATSGDEYDERSATRARPWDEEPPRPRSVLIGRLQEAYVLLSRHGFLTCRESLKLGTRLSSWHERQMKENEELRGERPGEESA